MNYSHDGNDLGVMLNSVSVQYRDDRDNIVIGIVIADRGMGLCGWGSADATLPRGL